MKKLVRLSLPALALLSLSSCALPPREAWRVIQHDGLIPYLAVEMGRKPVPKYVRLPQVAASRFVMITPDAKSPRRVVGAGQVYVARPCFRLQPTRYLDRQFSAVPVIVAPKPAARPAPVAPVHPRPVVAVAPKPVQQPRPPAAIAPKPVPHPMASAPIIKQVNPIEAEIAAAPKAKPAPPVAAEKPKVAPTPPAPPVKPVADASVAVKPVTAELPFGTPIPGRPGLVNSPFAGKYQLVDVTGLSAGQEVKCPYSGRIFRVPGVQQAAQQAANAAKALTEPPPPPAKKP